LVWTFTCRPASWPESLAASSTNPVTLALAAHGDAEHKGRFILSSAALFSLALILLACAHSFWWAFALLVVLGATMVGALALTNTALQLLSPPEVRGRIMSMYNPAVLSLAPIGSLQAGAVAQALAVRFALALGGAVCFFYFVILLAFLPRLHRVARLRRQQ
jgi:MFS family permease